VVIVAPVAVLTAAAVVVLLRFVDAGDPKNQIELIKIGLTVGAGTGGVVALILNGRRQWATEHDATERRLTELYVKAVEQLGSDKAAVRHGGLYALERVAQDNPSQRQTIVDVICAYLRAPYTPPTASRARRLGIHRPLMTSRSKRQEAITAATSRSASAPSKPHTAAYDEIRQEHEVRLTAQRILARHLRPGDLKRPDDTFWEQIDLDLTGANLTHLNMAHCRVRTVSADEATFTGVASFNHATFTRLTSLNHATFEIARFNEATFTRDASFEGTRFATGVPESVARYVAAADASEEGT
jgi:hypothetical protein